MTFLALAANMEETANAPPVETVPLMYVVLFVVLFLGLVIGFFAYLYWNEKRKTPDQQSGPGPT
jgi:hypothetical protein